MNPASLDLVVSQWSRKGKVSGWWSLAEVSSVGFLQSLDTVCWITGRAFRL